VVSFKPRQIYPQGKTPPPQYPLDRGLGGPKIRSGLGGEEKKYLPLPGIPIVQPIA